MSPFKSKLSGGGEEIDLKDVCMQRGGGGDTDCGVMERKVLRCF